VYAITCVCCPEFPALADAKKLERYRRQYAIRSSLVIGSFRTPSCSYAKVLDYIKQRILRERKHHLDPLFFFIL
jgi:hypothetical protein